MITMTICQCVTCISVFRRTKHGDVVCTFEFGWLSMNYIRLFSNQLEFHRNSSMLIQPITNIQQYISITILLLCRHHFSLTGRFGVCTIYASWTCQCSHILFAERARCWFILTQYEGNCNGNCLSINWIYCRTFVLILLLNNATR